MGLLNLVMVGQEQYFWTKNPIISNRRTIRYYGINTLSHGGACGRGEYQTGELLDIMGSNIGSHNLAGFPV